MFNWFGVLCENKANSENTLSVLSSLTSMLDSLDTTKIISTKTINQLTDLQRLIGRNTSLITNELNNQIANLGENQINLLLNGSIKADPNLLKVLDFSMDLAS